VIADYNLPENGNYLAFDWEGTYILKTAVGFPRDCYVADSQNGIAPVFSNARFTTTMFKDQELFFLNHDFRFRHRYSLNVLMYSIDQEAFRFLSEVDQQLSSTGSIFDPAPRQISSNVFNIADEAEVVLGFFGAFNVTEKRIFINQSEIPAAEPFDICDRVAGPGSPPDYCFDCRLFFGSSDQIPSFWE